MSGLDAVFRRAAGDRHHGAAQIERSLVAELLLHRQRWITAELVSGAQLLLEGQPAMANLRNLARELAGGDPETIHDWMERRSCLLSQLDERVAALAWPLFEGCLRALTISRSSTVAAVLRGAWLRGWSGETVVFDGSPAGGGADQVSELARTMEGLRSQPDSTMPKWLDGDGVLVLIGADAVSPRRLVNVTGTAALLELAAARSVAVVVVADSGKDVPDDEIDEILAASPLVDEGGSGRRWPIFEAAPVDLVTRRIRE